MTENELYHHGILGQKWGVRRFQNQDGSYTAAGKERYGIEDGKRRSLKSYALEYKDRMDNKSRYKRIKKNQNLDTMSYEEMKRLNDREQLKGQIQFQQKLNDPNNWKKQLGREVLTTAAKGLAEGASKELGKQLINAPVRLAAFTGNKAISATGWSAQQLVGLATDSRRQQALSNAISGVRDTGRYLNNPGYREYRRVSERNAHTPSWSEYNYMADRYRTRNTANNTGSSARGASNIANNIDRAASNAIRSGVRGASNIANNADRAVSNAIRSGARGARQRYNTTVWGNANGRGDMYEQAYYLMQPSQLRPLGYRFRRGI